MSLIRKPKAENLTYIKNFVFGSNTLVLVKNEGKGCYECRLNNECLKKFPSLNDDSVGYLVEELAKVLNEYVSDLDKYCITFDDEEKEGIAS